MVNNHLLRQHKCFNRIKRSLSRILCLIYKAQNGEEAAYIKLQQLKPKNGDVCDLLFKCSQFYLEVCAEERKLIKSLTEVVDQKNNNADEEEISEMDMQFLHAFVTQHMNSKEINNA